MNHNVRDPEKFSKFKMSLVILASVVMMVSVSILQIAPSTHDSPGSSFSSMPAMNIALTSPVKNNQVTANNYSSVNPNEIYTKEPAPMGIADFGIGPNGVPYSYNTTSFDGTVSINQLQTFNQSLVSKGLAHYMTFQLNLNLMFKNAGTLYVYWVQDVAVLNTSTDKICFLDNVWNMSSKNAKMSSSSISGNGKVSTTGFYYYQTKQLYTIITPTSFNMEMNATVLPNGFPDVTFMYNVGSHWIIYDTPNFTFAHSLDGKPVFEVNGYNYEPTTYTFYDAELIMGGPGNGSQTSATLSDVNLELQYWNGHNYQFIPNAYNFGSNTAEGICNIHGSGFSSVNNGTIGSTMTNGSGTLHQIYNSANLSFLKLKFPFSDGTASIDNMNITFVNGELNLTLPYSQNKYSLIIRNSSGIVYNGSISLGKGQSYKATFYSVSFTGNFGKSLLPKNFSWWVNVSKLNYSSNGSSIGIVTQNGTYSYIVGTNDPLIRIGNGFGNITISGAASDVEIFFNETLFNVTFHASNLNPGITWSVNIYNVSSRNGIYPNNITFQLPNGTYNFSASSNNGYSAISNSSGSISILGDNITVNVSFVKVNSSFTAEDKLLGYILPIILIAGIVSVALYYKRKK